MFESLSNTNFAEKYIDIWEKLKSHLLLSEEISKSGVQQISYISEIENESSKPIKLEITIKFTQEYIILTALVIGKLLEKQQRQTQYYLNLVNKLNKQVFKSESIFWLEQNKNFGARKFICIKSFQLSQLGFFGLFKIEIKQVKELLKNCLILSRKYQIAHLQKQDQQIKLAIQKKFNLLQKLKFQIQVNRRKRSKTTCIDFNFSKLKNLSQMIKLQEKCSKESQNYRQLLKDNQYKNQINAEVALEVYNKMLQNMKKKQNQNKVKNVIQEIQKILTPIKINYCKMVANNQKLQGSFSHIQIIESQFTVIHSLNLKTAEVLAQNRVFQNGFKSKNCILIRKKKCIGCSSECVRHKKANQTVFQNQKQILMILNPYFHKSICNFYVEQYFEKQEINSIYSKKLPFDPIKRIVQIQNVKNPIKYLRKVLKFLTQVAEGIKFLWNLQIIHRDLKPTNVMLDQKESAKIIDFGSSCPKFGCSLQSHLSQSFDYKLRSTKNYYFKYSQLPEQITSKYTKEQYDRHQSFDVFSLGSIIEYFKPQRVNPYSKNYQKLIDSIEYLTKKCKDIHPDDRITPLEATLYLKQLTALASLMLNDI